MWFGNILVGMFACIFINGILSYPYWAWYWENTKLVELIGKLCSLEHFKYYKSFLFLEVLKFNSATKQSDLLVGYFCEYFF